MPGVLLAYAIIKAMTGRDQLAQAWQALLSLRSICEQAVRLYDETKGHEFVARFHKSPMIYTVGGGLNYTNAYILATCYLTEMQWINACPVEASEFFHGVLEIADKDACFVALLGYGGKPSSGRARGKVPESVHARYHLLLTPLIMTWKPLIRRCKT